MPNKYKRLQNKHTKGNITVKIIIVLLMIILCQICFMRKAYTVDEIDEKNLIQEQAVSSGLDKIGVQAEKYSVKDTEEIIQGYDPEKIIKDASEGKLKLNMLDMVNKSVAYLLKEIYLNADILMKLIILVVLCALLKNLQTSFLSESVGELAFYACYISIVSIMLISFNTILMLALNVINQMVAFMQATVPVLITILISGGNITSAGIFQPVLIFIVGVAATTIKNVFIPLVFLSTVLSIVDNISDKVQISKLASFLKQITGWSLGIILTIFIGIVSIQGTLGAVVDGVTSKTAKFAIGAFIPIAGKYLADAADAVIGCAMLIKNSAGIAAMIGITAICLIPLLKILALLALYRITCILVEPISEKRITDSINEIAVSLTFILGITASVAFMFLLSITAIISAGNISAMIR